MKTILKSEAARRWKIVPSMVTRYVRMGMPVTSGGKINWKEAQAWRMRSICSSRSGSFKARQRQAEVAHPKENLSTTFVAVTAVKEGQGFYRALLGQILAQRNLVAGILAEIGIRDAVLLHAAHEVFSALVLGFSREFADCAFDWLREDIPGAKTDIRAVFNQYGLALTPEVEAAADLICERVYDVISAATNRRLPDDRIGEQK